MSVGGVWGKGAISVELLHKFLHSVLTDRWLPAFSGSLKALLSPHSSLQMLCGSVL